VTRLRIALAVVAAAFALVAAGCGGGGGAPGGAGVAVHGTAGALAFARCMRAHGIRKWPDPEINGVFDKSKIGRLGLDMSRVQAIQTRFCNYDFQAGDQTPNITPAEQVDYLRASACMRTHGYPTFPDPTFPNDHVRVDFPPNIDREAPRFRSAATICTKLIPRGLPYGRPNGS
jgi:hypothetical protein